MFYLIAGAIVAYTAYQVFFRDDHPSPDDHHPQPQPEIRRDDRHWQPPPPPPPRAEYLPQVRTSSARTQQNIDSAKRDQFTPEEIVTSLRSKAKQEGESRTRCRQLSKEAYDRGDHARAKALKDEAERHGLKRAELDADASAIIFKENNRVSAHKELGDPCKVDLHGLYVKEAIEYAQKAVTKARRRGDSEIRFIVGRGNHSENGVPRLKPEIQKDLQTQGHRVEVDPKNPGILLVKWSQTGGG